MKKVVVTGADGFIGSHLVELLLKEGYCVKALSYYNSFNYWGWIDKLKDPNLEIVTGDIRDPNFCRLLTKGADIIFHLAALIAIPYSYVAPDSYVDTNIRGTLNICQAARENMVGKLLITSTSEVYGTAQYVPISESHPKQPQSPYSATKIAADAMALSFYYSFDLPVVIVRPFNTYGPRQSLRAIIPTIITQIANGKKCIKVGDLTPTRDFNYVKDTCRGFLELSKCDKAIGKEINICSNTEISMENVLCLINDIMGKQVVFQEDELRIRPKKSEVFRLYGDNSLIRSLINYTPQFTLKDGLKETITWFCDKKNLSSYKCDIYNL